MMIRVRRRSRRAVPRVPSCLSAFVPAAPRAFSLAELMIALAILGFGLLIIGASLPIAMRYTKETVDRDTGAAALNAAFELLESRLVVPRGVLDANVPAPQPWHRVGTPSPIFVPRGSNGIFDPNHTPLIKVRALVTQNIAASPSNPYGRPWEYGYDFDPNLVPMFAEAVVGYWFGLTNLLAGGQDDQDWTLEADRRVDASGASHRTPWIRPCISSASLAFPGLPSFGGYEPQDFYYSFPIGMYTTAWSGSFGDLADRVVRERIHWTAFYRRVAYGPGSDPLLYEVILVATRKPSERHRFPLQTTEAGGASDPPTSDYYWGLDTAAPVPWLVSFSDDDISYLPLLQPGTDYDNLQADRPLKAGFRPPATLRFVAERSVGNLMPPGSIFIPAVNDAKPTKDQLQTRSGGFVPALKDGAPIYKVLERIWNPNLNGGHYEIIVENNGYYPWINPNRTAQDWPVWVIPPAIEELEGSPLEPVFTNQSPVIAIERRFVRLREVP